MIFTKQLRDGVRRGAITSSVRIWQRPHVAAGKRYRMEEGEIEVDSILPIGFDDITPELARESGFKGVIDLLKVAKHGPGENVYLVRFHFIPPAASGRAKASPSKAAKADRLAVAARIVVVAPPPGVTFALQRGRRELDSPSRSTGADIRFDFSFEAQPGPDGSVRFFGEFVQGPAGGKFVYVNSGTLAGQPGSPWTRRAKVGLQILKWATIQRAASEPGAVLEARIAGISRDGGPACATIPLLDGDWMVRTAGAATTSVSRRRASS